MKKTISKMLVVPAHEAELREVEAMLFRLEQSEVCRILSQSWMEERFVMRVSCGMQIYQVQIYPTSFTLPELYRKQHLFPDVDVRELERAGAGLAVEMTFGDDPLASYFLQLRIIHAVLPDMRAVLDDSSEKILSGRWVALAAQSQVPPAPRYLYTAQAVTDGTGCVWLHTHGLNRCGLPELEVLDSRAETYRFHYQVVETLANRLLENGEAPAVGEPFFLAHLTAETSLVLTLMDWRKAVERYPTALLGGKDDRVEGHDGDTCAIFVYPSAEDYEAGRCAPVSIYDKLLQDNPIYMISTGETQRMKALAAERMDYLYQALQDQENHVLVKLGLTIDPDYRTETNDKEHIWFALRSAEDGKLTAELTQEPYYVSGIHAGDVGVYPTEIVTDWIIYTPARQITPDDVYLFHQS